MPNRTSPTVRRRRLAAELRKLRKESGRSRENVAEHVGCAPATITRIENASSGAPPAYVSVMLDLYGLSGDEKDAWLVIARQARKRGWWAGYGDTIPSWFTFYVGLEEEASDIRSYQPELVFGLLQTEGYMRAVMVADIVTLSEDELERRIKVRLKRQRHLTGPDAPKLWIVLNEAVLRREVGSRAVMREQLLHLAEMSQDGKVFLQVMPFSAGIHPANDGAFNILGFPEPRDPDVVYVQYRKGSLYLEETVELAEYNEIFDHLRAGALGFDESRSLIMRIATEMA